MGSVMTWLIGLVSVVRVVVVFVLIIVAILACFASWPWLLVGVRWTSSSAAFRYGDVVPGLVVGLVEEVK